MSKCVLSYICANMGVMFTILVSVSSSSALMVWVYASYSPFLAIRLTCTCEMEPSDIDALPFVWMNIHVYTYIHTCIELLTLGAHARGLL